LKYILIIILTKFCIDAHSSSIIKNNGQIKDTKVLYYSNFKEWNIYFLDNRISFVKTTIKKSENKNEDVSNSIRFDLIPEFSSPQIKLGEKQHSYFNFILNNQEIKAYSYSKLTYQSIDFDIVFYTSNREEIKYDIISHSNNDLGIKKVIFSLEGNSDLKISNEDVIIQTLLGDFSINIPLAYSDIIQDNKLIRKKKSVTTIIEKNQIQYLFEVNKEDREIIIDPWSTFLGGIDADQAFGSSFDSYGNIFVSGYSSGNDFPITSGVIQTNFNGIYDSFVSKFDSTGQLIWSTYYGGNNNDFGNKIVVDENDQPIFTGYTYSNDLMVSSSGVFSSTFSGIFDAFLLRLKTDGSFDWATYYGGTGGEFVSDMDIYNNEIIIGGFTSSMNLPVISTAWQNSLAGGLDIFIAKFDTTGNRIWDTYYGGTNSEDAHTITFDQNGNVIVGGDTYSTDFPVSSGAYQNSYSAGNDICLVKFDSNGNMIWSTYLGSNVNEDCQAIDTDEFGNIYFTGYATGNGLPITNGIIQDTHSGDRDIILGSFSPSGNLNWLTFVGGANWDFPRDINVNAGGFISIVGETYSTDFPEYGNVFQTGNAGSADAFYIVTDSLGTPSFSTLLGGSSYDSGQSISFDNLSRSILVGYTSSANFPLSGNSYQSNIGGQEDVFIKTIDSTAGVFLNDESLISNQNFILYPNPTNGEIILMDLIPGKYMIHIYSINGKLVFNKEIEVNEQYHLTELTNLNASVYTIKLANESTQMVQKVVKF